MSPSQVDQPSSPGVAPDEVIRITADDARSSHVDDMLKRQASLRGEQGIARDHGRKWYYQNWFVFMIAGTLGALVAYALIDPYFNELQYAEGTVARLNLVPARPVYYAKDEKIEELPPDRFIELELADHTLIAITSRTRWRNFDGSYGKLDLANLKPGQKLGAYVLYLPPMEGEASAIATHLVPDPPKTRRSGIPLLTQHHQHQLANWMTFPLIAAFVGLFIAAADGIMCRLLRRVLLAGAVGLVIGLVGGIVSNLIANMVYASLSHLAANHPGTLGFSIHSAGRGLAWALAGMAMGLGQGVALRSPRLLLYGFLGGMIGGLFGGLLFDPIQQFLAGQDALSGALSRWVGFAIQGCVVGLMIGVVERLARDAWLRMVEGPLAGKEFLVFKDVMRMGASPRSEIYLFNDNQIAAQHAVIRATGDLYELENSCHENPVCLNGRPVTRSRLRHGDRITLGRTAFVFQRQRAE